MKKGAAITIICILAAAAIALGALYYTDHQDKTKAIEDKTNELAALTEAAAAKDGQIEKLTAEAAEKAGEIELLTGDVAAKAGEIETLTGDVAAKAGEIDSLTEAVATRDGQIDTLNKLVESKDEEIQKLTAEAADLAAQAEEAGAKIGEQETAIKGLEAVVKAQESTIAAREQEISELEAAKAELQKQVDSLAADVEAKAETIRNLSAEPDEKEHQTEKKTEPETAAPDAGTPDNSRLRYTEKEITLTLPASIKYNLGDQGDGKIAFIDTEGLNDARNGFFLMSIDLGMDASQLNDAMLQIVFGTLKQEIAKMDEISDAEFEDTTILGSPAVNFSFIFAFDGQQAPAYGTIIIRGQTAYLFFYTSLDLTRDQIKADMIECIGSMTLDAGGEPQPAEENPAEEKPEEAQDEKPAGLRFGMTRDEVKALLGNWDEIEDFTSGYTILRYHNTPFRDYSSTNAIIFRGDSLHLWLYGIQNSTEAYGTLEAELKAKYGDPSENKQAVIDVFAALDVTLAEAELDYMISGGAAEYGFWRTGEDADIVLMRLETAENYMIVYACVPPAV